MRPGQNRSGRSRASFTVLVAVAAALVVAALASADQIIAGGYTTCVLSNQHVACWGYNAYGQLGDGTTTSRGTPETIDGLTASSVSVGWFHVCAVRTDQTVACWGHNNSGQLGDGTTTDRTTPTTVSGITSATSVAASIDSQTCASLSDGTVECWGINTYGQLGDGATSSSDTPVEVTGISTATKVTTGDGFSCALLAAGTIKCWGHGNFGRLGNGTTASSLTPVTVSGISSATDVEAGDFGACALLSSGGVQCWGYNGDGELGNGDWSVSTSTTPVDVAGITSATGLSVGGYDACAVLSTGTVKCWGSNSFGENGSGGYSQHVTPVSVSGVTTATQVTVGIYDSCAELDSGAMYCWGYNAFGQLGDGTTTTSPTPVEVLPVNTVSPALSGATTEGETLSTTTGTWSNATSYSYQWLRCTTASGGCTDISGATASSYTLTSGDVGYTIRSLVTASNAASLAAAASSHSQPVWTSISQAELADEFRPMLLFDTDELWRPLNVDAFLSESFSDGTPHHQICLWHSDTGTSHCDDITSATDLTPVIDFDPEDPVYIDVHGSQAGGSGYTAPSSVLSDPNCSSVGLNDCNYGSHSAIYYATGADTAGYEYFNYWFFYRYNSTDWLQGWADNHEGDWENVTIVADARGQHQPQLAYAYYSEHNTGTWYTPDSLSLTSGHPSVYVAAGDHASYGGPCTTACQNPATGLAEANHDGSQPWGYDITTSCLGTCLFALPDTWASWGGLWGTAQITDPGDITNGPQSPEQQAPYKCAVSGWSLDNCSRYSGMRGLGLQPSFSKSSPGEPHTSQPPKPPTQCRNWFGGDVVGLVCDAQLLQSSIQQHRMRKRWHLKVGVTGGSQRVGSSPGVAQVLGGALTPGETLTVQGVAARESVLLIDVYYAGRFHILQFSELNLEHGGKDVLRIQGRAEGPEISLKTPRGVVRPSTLGPIKPNASGNG